MSNSEKKLKKETESPMEKEAAKNCGVVNKTGKYKGASLFEKDSPKAVSKKPKYNK